MLFSLWWLDVRCLGSGDLFSPPAVGSHRENTWINDFLHCRYFPETLHDISDLFVIHTHANSHAVRQHAPAQWASIKLRQISMLLHLWTEGIHLHRCSQTLSVLAYNNRNTVHQLFSLDVWVLPSLQQSTVPLIPNTWLALLDLWVSLRSEAIRLQMDTSFLCCSSGEYESLYWCG